MKKKLLYVFFSVSLLMFGSCEKYLTVNPKGFIPESENFKNADDAITSIYGLYGLMQPLVDQIFLAGEAQGDLVVAARGADKYIAEITQNRVTPLNPYTDYTNFYRLIIACNNAIAKLNNLTVLDPVNYSIEKYNFNAAEIIYIRAWTYLQLIKIWGDVPYITNSITMASQVIDIKPSTRAVILNNIEKELSDNLPLMLLANPVGGIASGDTKIFRSQFNNYSAQILLAEVNLYLGNYVKAHDALSLISPYGFFRMDGGEYSAWETAFPMTNVAKLIVFYAQYIDFDGSKGQKNSLIRWTNNTQGGIYALKPSTNAIKNWMNTPNILLTYQATSAGYYINPLQTSNLDAIVYDDGYPVIGGYGDYIRGNGVSYMPDGNDTLIFKYLIKSRGIRKSLLQNDAYSNDDALFPIYRDGAVHLMVCEILNRMGLSNEALLQLNGGSFGTFMRGTRYRVRVAPFKIDPDGGDAVRQVDQFILEEKALEAAFEGLRWFDLVRFAENAGDPSLLTDFIAKKYPASQQAGITERLRNPSYWYFPYYQRNVDANKLLKQKSGY